MGVDLHLHSTASDGTLIPAEIIKRAHKLGLTAIALTDHDSVAGIPAVLEARASIDLEFIPGLELSSEYDGRDVHVLGYFIDYRQSYLNEVLTRLRTARFGRARMMVDRLVQLGLSIDFAEVEDYSRGGAIGRPHVAQVLVKHGEVADVSEAFERYLGRGRPAYVPKYVMRTDEVIDLIHQAAGVASLAHPGPSGVEDSLVAALKDAGLDAVEAWHTDHTEDQCRHFRDLAKSLDLMVTGGSDCHGFGKSRGFVMGSLDIPDEIIAPLVARARLYAQA